jgi:hypothetical protein
MKRATTTLLVYGFLLDGFGISNISLSIPVPFHTAFFVGPVLALIGPLGEGG